MKIATVSSKRQITIPKSLLEVVGLNVYGKVFLEQDGSKITIRPIKKSVVEEVGGSLKKFIPKDKMGIPFSVVRKETQKKVAEYLANKK